MRRHTTPVTQAVREVVKTYDLSTFPQPEVVTLRASAIECQAQAYKLAGQFRICDAEVNLEQIEAYAADLIAKAQYVLQQSRKFRGAAA